MQSLETTRTDRIRTTLYGRLGPKCSQRAGVDATAGTEAGTAAGTAAGGMQPQQFEYHFHDPMSVCWHQFWQVHPPSAAQAGTLDHS
mmetsp:Transcript_117546/g.262785  ORF Transcript_117546/g.262785 Transcript_117546/m.262785 type:complete len:87 (+) Transcript_117546:100-360(+)